MEALTVASKVLAEGQLPALRTAAGIQGARDILVANANINVVGGDSHTHTHIHYYGSKVDLDAIFAAIANFRKIQQDTLAKATPGTVEWLFKSQYFRLWWAENGDLLLLWGSGIQGAGKTVLASVVINEIERRVAEAPDEICVAYFYMRYSEHSQVTVRSVLEVLVKQSVERHECFVPIVKQAYARHVHEGTQPTAGQLLDLLRAFIARMKITAYILDALDEAPFDIQLDLVKTLVSSGARVFITSRPMKDLQAHFLAAHCFEIAANDEDLDCHIASKIESSPHLQSLLARGSPAQRDFLIASVKSKCGGMFLHASLQLDALKKCLSLHTMKQILNRFPAKIEDVYHQTWERILNQDLEHVALAKAALLWVVHAKRSMTVDELCCAIATDPETHRFEDERVIPLSTIAGLCHGLLTVDEESRLVRLVHYTAKGPISRFLHSSFPHPHSIIAAVCMTHLAERGMQNTTFVSLRDLNQRLEADPLLAYAHDAWAFHARNSSEQESIANQLKGFVAQCHAYPTRFPFDLLGPWHLIASHDLPIPEPQASLTSDHVNHFTKQQGLSPLGLACQLGNKRVAQALLSLPGILVNLGDRKGNSPLTIASHHGHQDLVPLLLADPNLDVNLTSPGGRTALILACAYGHESIVKLLLEHPNVKVNLADNPGRTALILACRSGSQGIVRLLLARSEIEVNAVDRDGYTALILAVQGFHAGVVSLLLAHPGVVDVNLADSEGRTALTIAARSGDDDTIKLLLTYPLINVNQVNGDGDGALTLALRHGRNRVVELLLTSPYLDVNPVDALGSTPLIRAAWDGHEDFVKLLLTHAAINVNQVNRNGDTALMAAARGGHERIVSLLLAHPNTKVNFKDNDGCTALIIAARDNYNIVQLLLAHPDINVNTPDDEGCTALLVALKHGQYLIVKLLLAFPNIDVNPVDSHGDTPLIFACQRGHESAIKELLAHPRIKINHKDGDGDSALLIASCCGYEATVKLLLAHPDIEVNLLDAHGSTALMAAAGNGHDGVVQMLLEVPKVNTSLASADDGHTAMSVALANGHDAVVRLLQDLEANSKPLLVPQSWKAKVTSVGVGGAVGRRLGVLEYGRVASANQAGFGDWDVE